MGDALAAIGRQAGLSNDDVATMEEKRGKIAAEPMHFEP
ncbi:MAG: plasmid stabilization protein [Lautropia mirabilis]|nr:plasmid stabilization protein [Lautropia mirabilis]